jgi:chloramphenicol-sensitive protein RarD
VNEGRKGLIFGAASYILWGLFPIYWPLVKPAGALEILAHRMVWSGVFVAIVVTFQRKWASVRTLYRQPARLSLLALAAVFVSINWGTYIWGVNHDRVVETSLGYFINPLFTVLLGVLVLGERLRRGQWIALGFGIVAIAVIAIDYGRPPWIAITLAMSFGLYGLIKKKVGAGAVEGFTIETSVQFLPAVLYLSVLGGQGHSTFGHHGFGQAALLVCAGIITGVPLLLFAGATSRLPLTTLGLLQYLAPILQFAFGVLLFHEPMPAARLAGFALVWIALVILSADAVRNQARRRRAAAVTLAPEPTAV